MNNISIKSIILKATSYINDAIKLIDKQLNIMVPYADIISLFHSEKSMWCGIHACKVAYLPFEANANYGTWLIEFGRMQDFY